MQPKYTVLSWLKQKPKIRPKRLIRNKKKFSSSSNSLVLQYVKT